MLFHSLDFAIFLPTVFLLYWFAASRNTRLQNVLLIVASYVFYGWWDWRFLSLIAFSSLVDYSVGIGLSRATAQWSRKLLLLISIAVNLGFLGFFKYYDFFLSNFVSAFSFFGEAIDAQGLNVILPVGISFYTFQTLSYTIDVYRRRIEPTRDPVAFFAFVAFFPQLVAGPIERAANLLPQFCRERTFEYDAAADGMRQILWGLFKKAVIADNLAIYVNDIFANYSTHSGSTLLLGAVFFAFQIYADFSGYSDIAIGTARLFGFRLMKNFAFPYFSRDIAEFWRRWHISLSTWFRDYVYIPLGGSRGGAWMKVRNTFIIFLVSGLWHGASWTFIVWGALNALYFLPLLLLERNRIHKDTPAEGRMLPTLLEFAQIGTTFFLTVIAWVFFRAESVSQAVAYLRGVFSWSIFSVPEILPGDVLAFLSVFVAVEWAQRHKEHALEMSNGQVPILIRWALYTGILATVFQFGGSQQKFIYFQF